jgi:small subunit ribosomal protein S9
MRQYLSQPLALTGLEGKYDVLVSAKGGGISGQSGAIRHGLSRALVASDANLREVLKKAGCLTRDSRMKERKKPGQPGPQAPVSMR